MAKVFVTFFVTCVEFHKSKVLIIQFHTSNTWKNASHTFFIQLQKIIEKRFELVIRTKYSCSN